MTAFEGIVIGRSSIPALAATVCLMIVIPVVFFLYWRRKHKAQTKISWLIAGAVGFIVSARVLELGVHYFCIIADTPVSRFLNGNTAAFVLYGIAMAGVFEECGRYIILRFILKKNRTRENAVLYGIGHGGIEILAIDHQLSGDRRPVLCGRYRERAQRTADHGRKCCRCAAGCAGRCRV